MDVPKLNYLIQQLTLIINYEAHICGCVTLRWCTYYICQI